MREKLLDFCKKEGVLLDGELLDFFSSEKYFEESIVFLKNVRERLDKRFITKKIILENRENLESVIINSYSKRYNEFMKDIGFFSKSFEDVKKDEKSIEITKSFFEKGRKIEVSDFISNLRKRYENYVGIYQKESNINDLTSIIKIPGSGQSVTIISMILNKKITKNNNIILEVEDLTGKCNIIVSSNKEELCREVENLPLDSVLAFNGISGGNVMFLNKIIYPISKINERKKSNLDENVLFIGDIHFGSKKFMKKSFSKFIDYLNSNLDEVKKIKYIFIVGDVVTGIGNYPNQEKDLEISSLKNQYNKFSEILGKIRKDIKIIISPGNHDGVRLMEPQPVLNSKYLGEILKLENVVLIENPGRIRIGKNLDFFGFNVLVYHGFSFPYFANNIPELMKVKSMNDPIKIMKFLLKFRHLAPDHISNQHFPSERDSLFIEEIPDIFVSGHTHKSGISYKDNVLLVSVSTWESMTPYQKKIGNEPDFCKVPMLNLKTRAVKILDFEMEEENE